MNHQIRAAVESDASGVNEVSIFLGYRELPEPQAHENLNFLINSTVDNVYVSEVDGKIVGWVHVFYAPKLASESFYEIGGLVVNPEFRGLGIGRSLVQHVLNNFKAKFRVRCNEKRAESHQFYESIGFGSNKVQRVFEIRS